METATTLILGGTGKTGGRIIERLRARGVPVRVGSRSATPPFDWEDPATWPEALRDVERVYISYFPDLAAPCATEAISAFTRVAVKSGVRRLVLLSGRGEPEAQACEQIVRDCGVEWTLLRASWFAQNFSEGHLVEPILAGEVALPTKDVGEPFIDVDDIADVAVAALTQDDHVGELYELTGPRLLTFAQAIDEIAHASWREVRYREISPEQYAATLARAGVPSALIDLLNYLFSEVLDGRNASTADGVMRALGRAPRDFSDYARQAAASGVWNSGAL